MLIPPEAFVLDCWNLLILLLVLVQSVTIPLEAAYDLEPVLGPVIERVVWSLFVLDMCFNFFLAYPDPVTGELVKVPRLIAVRARASATLAAGAAAKIIASPVRRTVARIRSAGTCYLRGSRSTWSRAFRSGCLCKKDPRSANPRS